MKQISIFDVCPTMISPGNGVDLKKHINNPDPMCYSCRNAKKRGPWRLCGAGGRGYKHTGDDVDCDLYIWDELM